MEECVFVCAHACVLTHTFLKSHDVPMGRGNALQGRVTYAGVILGSSVLAGAELCDTRRMSVEGGGVKTVKLG